MTAKDSDLIALSDFGKLVADAFDAGTESVSKLYTRINNPERDWDYSAIKIFNSFSPEQKVVKAAQFGLERFIHYFFANMQDSKKFKIIITQEDGQSKNLIEMSDDILMELRDWLQDYSKFGSVGMAIMSDSNNKK